MMANPDKFQFLVLGKFLRNPGIKIENIKPIIFSEIIRITIDDKLSFDLHISDLFKVASAKIKSFSKIRNLVETLQSKLLYNSQILAQFSYCSAQ